MSVFEPKVFADPPNIYRPLKIIHGLDRYLGDKGAMVGLSDDDPAGQWGAWVEERKLHLNEDQISGVRQYLGILANLGVGGIVTNVGFQDYLESPMQWEILRQGLAIAQKLGLRVWLYDEKGYPSGTAAGKVTRANPDFAALGMACYTFEVTGPTTIDFPLPISCKSAMGAFATQNPDSVTTDKGLDLTEYIDEWDTLHWQVPDGVWTIMLFAERVMYEGTHSQGNVSEFKQYVNLLDPDATRAFLRVTHEAYYREIPSELWDSVEAIFTDEPSFMCYYVPALPERYLGKVPIGDKPRFTDRPMAVPWIHGFDELFYKHTGYDLKPYYYALFFSQSEQACYVRQQYYEVLTKLYADAYYGQIQTWCNTHGIASSGHLLLEENILDHVIFHGSMFDVIRHMDLPGLDMLSSNPEDMIHGGSFMGDSFMGIKQITSIAHVAGHERVHSESSDWEQQNRGGYATLQQRYGQANVQYALGVNQITSYFGWQELGTDAQRLYNNYVGRLGSMLTGGRHVCDVAVLYPIRTLWAHFVPPLQPINSWVDRPIRSKWESEVPRIYSEVVKTLLCHQIDVDIIDERVLSDGIIHDGVLEIKDEMYRVIVCPSMDVLSLDAARALKDFRRSGGVVLGVGEQPRLAESEKNTPQLRDLIGDLFRDGDEKQLVKTDRLVERIRQSLPADLKIPIENPNVLYTHRILEGRHIYFVVNNQAGSIDLTPVLRQPGPYTLYRPLTGDVTVLSLKTSLVLQMDAYEGVFVVCRVAT